MKARRYPAFALAALLLAGCAAGPRYQTLKRYVEPAAREARACVEGCGQQQASCQADCARRYQACRDAIMPEARARFETRLREYERQLADYRGELERYRMDLLLGWGYWHPHWGLWGGFPPFPPPPPPSAPTLEGEIARLTAERCEKDCGCEAAYDACFTACGSEILHERRCVAHCGGA